jgi:hypothetical protein
VQSELRLDEWKVSNWDGRCESGVECGRARGFQIGIDN